MTLSFLQAFHAKESGAISWDESIRTLVARCAGIKHEDDDVSGAHSELRRVDPLGYSVLLWSDRLGTIKDTSALEAVFKAYRHGVLEDVKRKAAILDGATAEGVNDSLALLALQERRADVLRYSLDAKGQNRFSFQMLWVFRDEADSVDAKKDPETFKALEESQFRKQFPPRGGNYKPKRSKLAGAKPGVEKSFDEGGKFPVHW